MSFQPEIWQWFLFGVALIVLEIFAPSFTIFWFGLAAIMVSGLLWLFPMMSFNTQIILWIILSIIITILWFKFIKPLSKDHTKAGLSREATIGQIGRVIQILADHNEVIVRFPMPILGSDEWICRSLDQLTLGDRVSVTDILGNQLLVTKPSLHNNN